MIIRCVTVGTINNCPDFHAVKIEASDDQMGDLIHVLTARRQAIIEGFYGQMVTFDENDSDFLIEHFDWNNVRIVKCTNE